MNGCVDGNPLHQIGRYSIIGLGVELTVRIQDDQFFINDNAQPLGKTQGAVLNQFREALAQAPSFRTAPFGLPFSGGLVGTSSFELLHSLDTVRAEKPQHPHHSDALYVAPSSLLIFDHVTRRAAFFGQGSSAEQRAQRDEVYARLNQPAPRLPQGHTLTKAKPTLTEEEFTARVQTAQEHIRDGDVFQLVLSVAHQGQTDLHPFQVYRALRLMNPSPYMYYLNLPGLQIVGSSPEPLVKIQGYGHASSDCGYSSRGDPAQDLDLGRAAGRPQGAAEHVVGGFSPQRFGSCP